MAKRLFIGSLCALVLLSACIRDDEEQLPLYNNLTLVALTEQPALSRTAVESDAQVFWEPGDSIRVFCGAGDACFATNLSERAAQAEFFTTETGFSINDNDTLWAVYPFYEGASFDGEYLTTDLPAVQVARAGSFGKNMNISVAHSCGRTLQFFNVGGGVRFSVSEEGIEKVIFEGRDNEILAGRVNVRFEEGYPVVQGLGEGSHLITLLPPDGDRFLPGQWYYMTAMPQSLEKGFRMLLYKGGQFKSIESEQPVSIKRSIFGSLEKMGEGLEFQDAIKPEDVELITSILESCEVKGAEHDALFTQRIDEIKAIPSVEDVYVNEEAASILLTTGSVIEHVFENGSIFDSGAIPSTSSVRQSGERKKVKTRSESVDQQIKAAEVVIFNLFSDIEGRYVQNELVNAAYRIFLDKYGSDKVCYCGFEDFTEYHLQLALESEKSKLVFINSHGLFNDMAVFNPITEDDAHHGRYMAVGGRHPEGDDLYKPGFVFANSDGKNYFTIDWERTGIHPQGDKIIYFSTCYTLSQDLDWKHACAVGWTRKSSIGQAYGVILADYFATYGKTLSAFWTDLSDDNGEIAIDWNILRPLRFKSYLVRKGNLSSADVALAGNSNVGFKQESDGGAHVKDIFVDKPTTGTCKKTKDSYKVRLKYNNWLTDSYRFNSIDEFNNAVQEPGFKLKTFGYSISPDHPEQEVTWGWQALSWGTGAGDGWFYNVNFGGSASFDKELTAFPVTIGNIQSGVFRISALLGPQGLVRDASYVIVSEEFEDNDADVITDPDDNPSEYKTPEAVDLGLSVKWASFNLGATKPEEYGLYYAWGETKGNGEDDPTNLTNYSFNNNASYQKNSFSFSTYKWCQGSENTVTKYCQAAEYGYDGFADYKEALDSDDDAAHVNLGGYWKMPTEEEWIELKENCTWEWTTDYSGTGVSGYIVRSKISGFTDNRIFIPAAGHVAGTLLCNPGTQGQYWTRYGFPKPTAASRFLFFSDHRTFYYDSRAQGCPIRPVVGAPVASVALNNTQVSLIPGASATLHATISPKNVANNLVSWSSSDESVATVSSSGVVLGVREGSTIITVRTMDGGKTATCRVTVKPDPSWAVAEKVDLGLPSGVQWATCNLGATKPEELGQYYAWGELEPREEFSFNMYKWSIQGKYTRYCFRPELGFEGHTDDRTTLGLEDDAAHNRYGGRWRMPTREEVSELLSFCRGSWETENGVEGRRYTSSINGNSVFFPISGYFHPGWGLRNGTEGYYWTSSLSEEYTQSAAYLNFGSDSSWIGSWYRELGMLIRPVFGCETSHIPLESISIHRTTLDLAVGEEYVLMESILPSNATNRRVSWSSTDESIATITSAGKVRGISMGETVITVRTEDGNKTASCKVTVSSGV